MHNSTTFFDRSRRTFVATLTKALGATLFLPAPLLSIAGASGARKTWAVGEIMDLFVKSVPGAPLENTVDTLKAGSRDQQVTGVVTTMFATMEVIQKAIAAGANFIIAHEPTFYNHADVTDWLQQDAVYQAKMGLLQQHNIAVWRNHDYIHRHQPDGILKGVVDRLGWQKYQDPQVPGRFTVPSITLEAFIQQAKKALGISMVRYIGELSQTCSKVLLMPGAYGGRNHIEAIRREAPEVAVVGEIQEWETAEYVRDARAQGKRLSLVVLGHTDSEEPGAAFMAQWLKEHVPGVKVTHIPSGNPLRFA